MRISAVKCDSLRNQLILLILQLLSYSDVGTHPAMLRRGPPALDAGSVRGVCFPRGSVRMMVLMHLPQF